MIDVRAFFDPDTSTLSYVAWDPDTRDAVVIDPVLDYDALRVSTSRASVDALIAFVRGNELTVRLVLDTHAHADHLSGAWQLGRDLGVPIGIGANITTVQRTFARLFAIDLPTDGSQWDALLHDGETVLAGSLELKALHTPGHTPACMSYLVGDALFTGDTMFMPDFGTGRCDFPGGSAERLWESVQKLYELPDDTRVFVGHDYQPGGRPLRYETTIGEQRRDNVQLRADTSREDFVRFRTERDATLAPPRLILQSLQVNVRAGELPDPDEEGRRFLKLPMDALTP